MEESTEVSKIKDKFTEVGADEDEILGVASDEDESLNPGPVVEPQYASPVKFALRVSKT